MDKTKEENRKVPEQQGLSPKTIVTIIAVLYIIGPLIHINTLISQKDWYFSLYSYMPQWLLVTRYSFSWLQRILALTAAIGILYYRDLYRKLLIALCSFTILTVYWKHPYEAFHAHTKNLDAQFGYLLKGAPGLTFESLTVVSIIAHCLVNIAFSGTVIYFLTRPRVKNLFK
jgi:hypothetical protein